jgi:hypothetical protein
MSVFMMLQVEGDRKRLAQAMSGSERGKRINARAVEDGAIHHRFFASAGGKTIASSAFWHPVDTPDQF